MMIAPVPCIILHLFFNWDGMRLGVYLLSNISYSGTSIVIIVTNLEDFFLGFFSTFSLAK